MVELQSVIWHHSVTLIYEVSYVVSLPETLTYTGDQNKKEIISITR